MPKKVLIALPPAMLEQVDFIAQCEHRTRSDLIREALRRYLDHFRRSQQSHILTAGALEQRVGRIPNVVPLQPIKPIDEAPKEDTAVELPESEPSELICLESSELTCLEPEAHPFFKHPIPRRTPIESFLESAFPS